MNEKRIKHWIEVAISQSEEVSDIDMHNLMYLDFEILDIFESEEPYFNHKGVLKHKNFYYVFKNSQGNEVRKLAVRYIYHKIYKDHSFEGETVSQVWSGNQLEVRYYRCVEVLGDGEDEEDYYTVKLNKKCWFFLNPYFENSSLIGFSSILKQKYLYKERLNADKYLQSKSPEIYSFLYSFYRTDYEKYLVTGKSDVFVDVLDNESRLEVLEVLNRNVTQLNLTIKELIIVNLQ